MAGPPWANQLRVVQATRPTLGLCMTIMADIASEINRLWNYGQVAAYLGCSLSNARRLPIPHIRFGRLVRFDPEQVRNWAIGYSVPRKTGGTNG